MKLPSKEKIKAYLENDSKCPWCNSGNIVSCNDVKIGTAYAWQPITCGNCGAEWEDQYTLTGIICSTDSGDLIHSDKQYN